MSSVAPVLDHETRIASGDHHALKVWLRLLTCANLVEREIRRNLRASFDCTLPRFDLLAQLARDPEGLKMSELSQRLMVTGGNVTGLADQLEAEGWLTREPVADDRRATRLRLTASGRARFAAMASEHEGWVVSLLGSLSRDDQLALYRLLGKLKAGVGVGVAGGPPAGDVAAGAGAGATADGATATAGHAPARTRFRTPHPERAR